jgi:ABC-2 type transport system permease protein
MTNANTNYQPTLIEKLLGRNYKWWYVSKYSFLKNTVYRWNSVMWLGSSFMIVSGTLLVWYINSLASDNFTQSFGQIFTYFIIGEAFIFNNSVQFDIGENIQDGKITNKLLLPISVFKFYTFQVFGFQLFENISKLLIYLIIGFIFSDFLILPSFLNGILFLLFLTIAFLINNFLGILVGLSAFWLTAFFGSAAFVDNTRLVLSGKFFPLNVLFFLRFSLFLPFAFSFYHPMQIYLGKYNFQETLAVFSGGIIWCLVLYFLAKLVFKMGLKKNEAVGL